MICIKLPKSAVKDIKMLVGKIIPYPIDVIFCIYVEQSFNKVRILEISVHDLSIIVLIQREEYSHNYCISIPVLKLWGRLKKFKPWMCVKQNSHQRLEVTWTKVWPGFLPQNLENSSWNIKPLVFRLPNSLEIFLLYLFTILQAFPQLFKK